MIMPKLLRIKIVRGTFTKTYIIKRIVILKKGLCFESERTTHQNIVEYGRADARKIYWKKVNCEQVSQ